MRAGLLLLITFLLCFPTFGQSVTFYKTTKKRNQYYIEITEERAKVYKMGTYMDNAGSGPAILQIDTLRKKKDNEFIGTTYSFVKTNDHLTLKKENARVLHAERVKDEKTAYVNLNNAYYLKSYFDLSDKINQEFPLTHYSFRNGYFSWNRLSGKAYLPEEFKRNTDREIQTVYDSIAAIQTRLAKTTEFIIENSKQTAYTRLKDSLKTLPIDYQPKNAHFTKSVYQMAQSHADYFYKLLQDFPTSKTFIYLAVDQDKELIKQLKQVQGYDELKKEFLKEYSFGKTMPYKVFGGYAVLGGLLTWLILSQN